MRVTAFSVSWVFLSLENSVCVLEQIITFVFVAEMYFRKNFVMVFLLMRIFIFALIIFIVLPCFDIENGRGCSCEDFCQELSSKQWEQQYFFP